MPKIKNKKKLNSGIMFEICANLFLFILKLLSLKPLACGLKRSAQGFCNLTVLVAL
jgi:hypothetical protein